MADTLGAHICTSSGDAAQLWMVIGVDVPYLCLGIPPLGIATTGSSPGQVLSHIYPWKHGNEVIFRGAEPSLLRLLLACQEEARLWALSPAGSGPRNNRGLVSIVLFKYVNLLFDAPSPLTLCKMLNPPALSSCKMLPEI